MPNLASLYRFRFNEADLVEKKKIWKVLCNSFFQELIGKDRVVVDLACGYGEFISNIKAKRKIGVDLNTDVKRHMDADVELHIASAHAIDGLSDGSVDVVFTSNFLEHLRSKEDCDKVFAEVRRILRPGGKFVVMGPNIRYLAAEYWDFYDHYLPLSHLSVEEGLVQAGFAVDKVIPRFLPYTTRSHLPKLGILIALYVKLPMFWPLLGRQFLVVASNRPDVAS